MLAIIAIELTIVGILFVVIGCTQLKKDKLEKAGTADEITSAVNVGSDSTVTGTDTRAEQPDADTPKADEGPSPEEIAEQERIRAEEEAAAEQARLEEEARLAAEALKAQADTVLETADLQAAMYDYDAAIATIQEYEGYEENELLTAAIASYEEAKSKLVQWPDNTHISHIFVHSLIVDTDRAFGPGSSQPVGYNRYMTTISEFRKMIQSMYEKGYVMVSMHDIAKVTTMDDGTQKLVKQPIMLPEGKIPFVLSQDDVNYYLYMEGDGFAERIVLGSDGLPTCEYIEKDGTVVYGEYDMLPIIDAFVKEHPDFSYHGHKGILALTGYEGALGYDTGLSMKIYDDMSEDEKMNIINAEREKVIALAEAIKADGWDFASHSYTHSNMSDISVSKLDYDCTRWHDEVESLVGPTDIYIYPYGADICSWRGYSGEKYEMLKEAGFWYFCNVDSAQYWIQLTDDYMRMGRINTDGERMNVTPDKLTYFFDVDEVYDSSRPPF